MVFPLGLCVSLKVMQTLPTYSQAEKPTVAPVRSEMDLSVVIVNYNVREFLEQALRSVERAATGLDVEVFVVDNNSADGSVEMVQEKFAGVTLIANDANVGFGKANNQAIRQARGKYLLILNPDTIVQENTFRRLIRFMEQHPEAGAAGCRILNPDGSFAPESRRAFPTPVVAFYRVVGLSRLFPRSRVFGRYNMTYLPEDEEAEVDALSGSCMLVRRTALRFSRDEALQMAAQGIDPGLLPEAESGRGAGGFDEDFFMYGEDLDWCFRIQEAGWKIFYTPETEIIHYKGESTKKGELRYVRLFYGAMLHFIEKHFHNRYSRLFALAMRIAILMRAGITVAGNVYKRLLPLLFDFLLVYGVAVLIGWVRSAEAGTGLSGLFFVTVAPAYALSTVTGITLSGGYRYARRRRIQPVLIGTGLGLLLVAAISFFFKDIAFSRAIVLFTFPMAALVLIFRRLAVRVNSNVPRRAVVVGRAPEAERLHERVLRNARPPFELVGFVSPANHGPRVTSTGLRRIGVIRQLRDIVRLQGINEVIFATGALPNTLVFKSIRQLYDLPLQFKMLAGSGSRIIGKAAVEDLTFPSLIEAEEAIGELRRASSRRAFEIVIALGGIFAHPVVSLAARITRNPWLNGLARYTRKMPQVLVGRLSLVGYTDRDDGSVAEEYDLRPAVFSVAEAASTGSDARLERPSVYWFYARNQSAALDWDILIKSLKREATERRR